MTSNLSPRQRLPRRYAPRSDRGSVSLVGFVRTPATPRHLAIPCLRGQSEAIVALKPDIYYEMTSNLFSRQRLPRRYAPRSDRGSVSLVGFVRTPATPRHLAIPCLRGQSEAIVALKPDIHFDMTTIFSPGNDSHLTALLAKRMAARVSERMRN